MNNAERVAEILGGPTVLHSTVTTLDELDRLVRKGLPKRSLQLLAKRVVEPGKSVNEFVYKVVPSATYKRRERLSAEESERTERLARVVALAEELWGDKEAARSWLNQKLWQLDGETPLEAARTDLGARRFEEIVYSIEHGLPL
jgi:putative toxin-antitoxin system antitoxin component (TIGR02293 family)